MKGRGLKSYYVKDLIGILHVLFQLQNIRMRSSVASSEGSGQAEKPKARHDS